MDWSNTWVRIGVAYPVALIAPWAAAAELMLLVRGDKANLGWALWLVLAGSAASFIVSCVTIVRREPRGARAVPLIFAAVVTAFGVGLAVTLWYQGVKLDCHGRYECPF